MAQDKASLLDLCSICYTEKPKYRCPRCRTQTCSLPCYKRHQQRATCNGKRDPAAYLKKSELATPARVDQDYNYLKNVERGIDRANRDTLERGIGDRRAASRFVVRGINPEGPLQRYLTQHRIQVIRAPNGMSRQQNNITRSTKRNHIMWTVQWNDGEGTQNLQQSALSSSSVRDLYDLMRVEQRNAAKRKADADADADTATDSSAGRDLKRGRIQEDEQTVDSMQASPPPHSWKDAEQTPVLGSSEPQIPASDPPNPQSDSNSPSHHVSNVIEEKEPLYFYLLKPNTPSNAQVLIPISPTTTLTDALRDRSVLEYPTLYALRTPPSSLPPGFATEAEHIAARKREDAELGSAVRQTQEAITRGGIVGSSARASARPDAMAEPVRKEVDANRILDMLRRDIAR